jgi:hypothetical protein
MQRETVAARCVRELAAASDPERTR